MKKELFQKWFRKDNLIILFLTGILLMVISWPSKGEKQNADQNKIVENADSARAPFVSMDQSDNSLLSESWENYVNQEEQKVKRLLEQMAGVGKVEVMITVHSSEELVVEKECPVDRKETKEQDSSGGSRFVNEVHTTENIIYTDAGNMSNKTNTPLVIKTILPQIKGMAIAAQGAENIDVRQAIMDVMRTLYNLESFQVKVVAMKK